MAGLILSGVGAALGNAIGGSILGISAATIGQSIGAVIGSTIDNYLFAPSLRFTQEGPRLQETQIFTSSEGQPILRGYGRFRVPGNMIWATRFREEVVRSSTTQGGKGGGGGTTTEIIEYNYYANFAVGLCEGEIQDIHRVWADNKLINLEDITYRVYKGTETQTPDSLITTKEGSGNAPSYRGLAYIVFEDFQINEFGNRVPQFSFEVTKPVNNGASQTAADLIKGVDLIPGTTEFGYDPNVIEQVIYSGGSISERRVENNHVGGGKSNWEVALDQLEENLPNCNIVSLVVTWFGDDLRIGNCTIKPKVENSTKQTDPISWTVAGLTRSTAGVISTSGNGAAFGGTPNDLSIFRAIQDLNTRGFEVMFYPFIIMDIEDGNTLPNPYSDNASSTGQSVYPWRGRITCSPAIGYVGTVDKTATAKTQIDTFLGTADASEFSGSGGAVTYSGTTEWGFNRFILHMAELCRQAGGVDYFCIGTEMVNSTIIRDNLGDFPFVDGLVSLAAEVATLLPSAKLSYAADWSEYHSYRPSDGSGDVLFNMDKLWSNSNIDFIGIDNYLPISDWRDGIDHEDYGTGNDTYGNSKGESIYDLDYLKGQIEGGEYYDYYYASTNDRLNQTRTAIDDTDPADEDWVFGNKRMKEWWQNVHHDRPLGVRSGSSTSWVAESKPIIFTEYGCPSINKGTNQPNVFYDPKSSESNIPYFSSGGRDDEIQRQYITAIAEYWASNNVTSSVYSDDMIDTTRMCYWSYDARPWPTFPTDGDAWADQANWQYGHWISGRIDTVYIPDLLKELASDYDIGVTQDFSKAYGSCDGFIIQSKTSFRSTVEPLATLFMFDIIESGASVVATSYQETRSLVTVDLDDIIDSNQDRTEPVMITTMQETELPSDLSLRYIDILNDYAPATVTQGREVVEASGSPATDTPIVIDMARAQQLVDRLLYSAWSKRDSAEFGLLPEFLYLEPGDVLTINALGFNREFRLESIGDGSFRDLTARSFDQGIFEGPGSSGRTQPILTQPVSSSVILSIMDLPTLRSTDIAFQPYVASYINPWPGVNIHKSITTSNYSLDTTLTVPTIIGETTDTFASGVTDVWDNSNKLKVVLYSDSLGTLDEESVFNGANSLAIENSNGDWEIVQFVNAQLTGTLTYTLTKLLRGQLGTEDNMEASLASGARIALLDSTINQLQFGLGDLNREYNIKYGPANKDIGDPTYLTIQYTHTGRGLKPFSPVHITAVDSSGDAIISWIRRDRLGADGWDYLTDIPLSEANESYEVDVMTSVGGSTVARTLTVTGSASVTYTAAQQATDGITAPFDVIVYQISDQVGRGTGRRSTLDP